MIADLEGRVAVVTGAASGIGRASAASFAAAGMRVVLADVNDERLAESVVRDPIVRWSRVRHALRRDE